MKHVVAAGGVATVKNADRSLRGEVRHGPRNWARADLKEAISLLLKALFNMG